MNTLTVIEDYLDALLDSAPDASVARVTASVVEPVAIAGDIVQQPPLSPTPAPIPPPAPVTVIASAPLAAHSRPDIAAAIQTTTLPALASSHRWLRIVVGDDSYALELLRVQEVVRLAPIVAMRGAARAVLGVMNLRGRIVPVFDLGLWLAAGSVHGDERSRIVVIERNDELMGVLVSAVDDVVTLGRERIEPPMPGTDCSAIVGIARVGPTPTVLLDANALFD